MITLKEVEEAIAQQERNRDQALAQANFHAGYIASLKEIKALLERAPEQAAFATAQGEFPESLPDSIAGSVDAITAPPALKDGRKQGK